MRYFVLVLILLNLGWLGWYFWIAEPPAGRIINEQDNATPTLSLAAKEEKPALPALQATEEKVVASVNLDTGQVTKLEPAPVPAPDPASEAVVEAPVEPVAQVAPETQPARKPAPASAPEPEQEIIEVAVEPIETLEEDETPPAPAEPKQVAQLPSDPMRCVSLGPFPKSPDAKAAVAKLTTLGFAPNQRQTNGQVLSGKWVFLDGYTTRPQASKDVDALERQGVRDILLLPASDPPHISLGFYSNPVIAQARVDEISKFGFKPKVTDRYKDAQVYWVDVEVPVSAELDASDYNKGATAIELRDCPRLNAAAQPNLLDEPVGE